MNRDASLNRILARDRAVGHGRHRRRGDGRRASPSTRRRAGTPCCLLEQSDFGKGTSSRSTKLVHGGVRYLQQGNISLVMEALKERGILRQQRRRTSCTTSPFVVPNYDWWEAPFYGIGMKVYDMLAGRYGFGRSRLLSKDEVLERIPTLETDGPARRRALLRRPVRRRAAADRPRADRRGAGRGARQLRPRRRRSRTTREGFVDGLTFDDVETGAAARASAPACVINATGAFCDAVRQHRRPDRAADDRAEPGRARRARPLVPARRRGHHGPAHERRPRDVRDPVARARAARARPTRRSREVDLEPAPTGARDRLHPRDRRAVPRRATRRAPTCSACSPASGRWSKSTARSPAPRRCRATTRSTSPSPACSRSPAGSGRRTARWPRTASTTPRRWPKLDERPCVTRTLQHPRPPRATPSSSAT